ncbi:MAG: hypothetical protein ACI9L9_000627 [Marivirga sp.]|jgi:hypothetical protein
MKRLLLFLFLGSLFSACMKSVSITSMRPAVINISSDIQTVVLVDRTKYEKEGLAILEGILTGEGINEDRDGVLALFSSLQNNLRNSPRFTVKQEPQRLLGNSLTGSFPEPLSWRIVEDLGRRNAADAVLAVEVFDSDFILTNGKRKKTRIVKDTAGKELEEEYIEYYAEGIAGVRIGIRLYNIQARSIEDQDLYSENRTWETTATSLKEAMSKMVQKSQATKSLGGNIGAIYASKIAPMPVYLSRTYYYKPKKNTYISRGDRQASVNNWEDAITSWKTGMRKSDDSKIMGRMAYNIALGYEVLGDFESAKDWAAAAYVDYGEKKGQAYARTLQYRIEQEAIVNDQMSLPEQSLSPQQDRLNPEPIKLNIKPKN